MTSPKNQAANEPSSASHVNPSLLKSLGCIGTVGLLGSTSLMSNVALAQGSRNEPVSFGEVAALVNQSNADLVGLGTGMFAPPESPPINNEVAAVPDIPVAPAPASEVAMAEAEPAPAPVEAVQEVYMEPEVEAYVPPEPAYVPETYAPETYVPEAYAPETYEPAYVAEPEPVYVAEPEPAYIAEPEPYAVQESPLPAPELEAPVVNLTPADLEPPTPDSFNAIGTDGSSAVIDSSDLYSTGATGGESPLPEPSTIVVNEGEPETVIALPEAESLSENDALQPTVIIGEEVAEQLQRPPSEAIAAESESSEVERPAVFIQTNERNASLPVPQAAPTTQVAGNASSNSGYSVTYPTQVQNPLQMVVQGLGRSLSQSVDAASYYARTQRPSALPGNGDRRLLFPLSMPSPISSVFGWRVHPIHQTWKFHSGTDFAAEQGTPIVAALSGRVGTADFIGGYGLTVVIDHIGGQSQTLYGHMSELFVRPGQMVRQGEVIGRAGSTGYSTGPHLHFEVRHQDASGEWVAVNPEQHLEGSVAQLMNALRGQPFQLGQLSPIPMAQNPFKIKPSQTLGLSTGLTPLLQSQEKANLVGQSSNALTAATPLERAVAQVVRSLETQPYGGSASRRAQPVSRGLTQPQAAIQDPALSQANSNVPSSEWQSSLPTVPQPPRKLAQAELERD